MIVKSPLKEKTVRPNLRKVPNGRTINDTVPPKTSRSNKNFFERKKESKGSGIKPWKIILTTLVLGGLGILYLNHVFATQKLLQEVQQLEREYNQEKRTYDNYRLTYDRMTGPANIYEKARGLGFINGGPADRVIIIEE